MVKSLDNSYQNVKLTESVQKAQKLSLTDEKSLKKSAEEFEALFFEIMLKSMRESVEKEKLIDGGNSEKIFQSMLDSEYARMMGEKRLMGIADKLESQLKGVGGESVRNVLKKEGMEKYQM